MLILTFKIFLFDTSARNILRELFATHIQKAHIRNENKYNLFSFCFDSKPTEVGHNQCNRKPSVKGTYTCALVSTETFTSSYLVPCINFLVDGGHHKLPIKIFELLTQSGGRIWQVENFCRKIKKSQQTGLIFSRSICVIIII